MARKEIDWNGGTGRDSGKVFRITEMSARAGHSWATRMLLALMGAGVEIDEDIMSRGLAGLATIAIAALGKTPPTVAMPLMDELMACVQSVQPAAVRRLMDDDIEEIATIFMLQKAVFQLHIEPFTSGGLLSSPSNPTAQ